MGSFNITCTATNIDLRYGTPVRVFLMLKTPQHRMEGSIYEDFCPFALPFSARLAGGNSIEDVKPDVTVSHLERLFQSPIREIVSRTMANEYIDVAHPNLVRIVRKERMPQIYAAFIHADVYERYVTLGKLPQSQHKVSERGLSQWVRYMTFELDKELDEELMRLGEKPDARMFHYGEPFYSLEDLYNVEIDYDFILKETQRMYRFAHFFQITGGVFRPFRPSSQVVNDKAQHQKFQIIMDVIDERIKHDEY